MKYSDKLSLLLKGVKMDDIKALEQQEKEELEKKKQNPDPTPDNQQPDPTPDNQQPDPEQKDDYKQLFEEANNIIKEMETKLQENQTELGKLKNEIAAFNNRQTQEASPEKYDDTAVFRELFNKKED